MAGRSWHAWGCAKKCPHDGSAARSSQPLVRFWTIATPLGFFAVHAASIPSTVVI